MPIFDKFFGSIRSKPKLNEIAEANGGILAKVSPFFNGNPDDLIASRSYLVYDQMQKDAQVQACLSIKKFAVLSRGWEVHSASSCAEDVKIADFVRFALADMRGSLLDVLYNVLDAVGKGFSVLEINFKLLDKSPYNGMLGLESIKSKDPSTFVFEMDEFLNIKSLARNGGVYNKERLPVDKFIIYPYMPSYESPYGTSDLRAAYKHYWSKDLLTKFLNLYLEKYGSPTAKGSYKRGTPRQAQEELLRVLDKIKQETAVVIPDDVSVELLEAQRGGEAGYLNAIQYHDKQIAKAILGQTLMTEEGMKVGSFALAKVHLDILKMCLKKLKRDLEESVMQEQVIKKLVDFNFQTSNYPTFSLGPVEDRDMELLADAIVKLIDGEVIMADEEWIRDYLGIPERR